jgi:hypothetical protein
MNCGDITAVQMRRAEKRLLPGDRFVTANGR